MEFNRRLTETRRAMGLTQAELAERLSTTPIAIERWENGETQPDINDLVLLADALSVSTDHLCGKKSQEYISVEKKKTSALDYFKYVVVLLVIIALFASGYIIGADVKFKKENSKVLLPQTVTISNLSFSKKNNELHFHFLPNVTGKKIKYKITFRDYVDKEFTYDVPLSESGCFGIAKDLTSSFIDVVTITVSSPDENRIIMVASNLQTSGSNVTWDTVKN